MAENQTIIKCAFCKGTGIQPRSLKSRCLACQGRKKVTFDGPTTLCPACQGTGQAARLPNLPCLRCRGVGVIERAEDDNKGNTAKEQVVKERLAEITKRLKLTEQAVEKKTEEIRERLEPIKPFISARGGSAFGGKELKKEIQWLKELINKIKKSWQSLWRD